MIKNTKHSGTNYKALKPFLAAVDAAGGYKKFTSGGYMDLSIEDLQYTDHEGNKVYMIAHYGKQNGDLMADPEMEFAIDTEAGKIRPLTFRNDYIALYQEVFKEINGRLCYSQRLLTDLDTFLWQWLKNIADQGFKAAQKTINPAERAPQKALAYSGILWYNDLYIVWVFKPRICRFKTF